MRQQSLPGDKLVSTPSPSYNANEMNFRHSVRGGLLCPVETVPQSR